MNPAVSFKNVSKGYRRGADVVPVLESLDLEIGEGEFVARLRKDQFVVPQIFLKGVAAGQVIA